MTMLWINVLLAIPFIALWAGIPHVARAEAAGRQAGHRRGTRRQDAARGAPRETPATAGSPSPACGEGQVGQAFRPAVLWCERLPGCWR